MFSTIDEYNKTINNKKDHIKFNPDALNLLVQSMIPDDQIASMKYRDFTKSIENICSYAYSKNIKTVNSRVLKNKTKEKIPADFFFSVDREIGVGGYFDMNKKDVGVINGLWASDSNQAGQFF